MDLQLRALRVERDRLLAALEAARVQITSSETNIHVVSLRKQLAAMGGELTKAVEAAEAASDRAARAEAEMHARSESTTTAHTSVMVEVSRREAVQRSLDEKAAECASLRDTVATLQSRLAAQKADFEHQLALAQVRPGGGREGGGWSQ